MKTLEQKINHIVRVTYYDDDANLDEAVQSIMKAIVKSQNRRQKKKKWWQIL